MDKAVRESLELITAVLDLLNNNIEELDKCVNKIEESIDDEYITIRIHKNASNLDVLRKVFGCIVTHNNERYAHINLDEDTVFHMDWLKTRYGGIRE